MDAAQRLEIVEEVKRVKARYFLHLDRKEWDRWGEVFAADVVMDVSAQFPDAPDPSIHILCGRDTVVRSVAGFLGETVTAHHGHTPLVDVESTDAASAIWAMEDNLFLPDGARLAGYGHYEEAYRRIDGAWRIARTKLTRIKVIYTAAPAA